jgi:hypothetical protein
MAFESRILFCHQVLALVDEHVSTKFPLLQPYYAAMNLFIAWRRRYLQSSLDSYLLRYSP